MMSLTVVIVQNEGIQYPWNPQLFEYSVLAILSLISIYYIVTEVLELMN